jgi:vesicle transport protein SEC22
MTLAESPYPQKLAHMFLQEVGELFQEELKAYYGSQIGIDYQSKIETIENSYAFLKFEKVINKKRKEYRDS